MAAYITSLVLLFLSHALLSAPGIRRHLISALPKPVFYTFYSAISLGALAYVIHTYRGYPDYASIYVPIFELRLLIIVLMPMAFILVICRISTPYPKTSLPYGIYAVCRFPGSVGITIWAFLHMLSVGDLKRLALFACMMAIALFAMVKNTAVLKKTSPVFVSNTSVIPFMASPRNGWKKTLAEIGIIRPLLALAIYGAALYLHEHIFGISPLSGLQ